MTNQLGSDLLDIAVAVASAGWPVLPFVVTTTPDGAVKRPACEHGAHDASRDPTAIRAMFTAARGATHVAVATGPESETLLLDIDPPQGNDWLDERALYLPRTLEYPSRRGLHLLYRCGGIAGNLTSTGELHPGVDTKFAGGSAIVWRPDRFLESAGYFCDAPQWLLDEIAAAKATRQAARNPAIRQRAPAAFSPAIPRIGMSTKKYCDRALDDAILKVARAPRGQRNRTLWAETFSLTRLVATRALDIDELRGLMAEAARRAGLDEIEIANTIDSALRTRTRRHA